MATAAVRRGIEPCEISEAVANAVGCKPEVCKAQQAAFEAALERLAETSEVVLKEAADLAEYLGWSKAAKSYRTEPESFWEELWAAVTKALRIGRIMLDIFELLDAVFEMLQALADAVDVYREYVECLQQRGL